MCLDNGWAKTGKGPHSVSVPTPQFFRRWAWGRSSVSLNHDLVSRTLVLSDAQRGGHRHAKQRGGFHQKSQEMVAPSQNKGLQRVPQNHPRKLAPYRNENGGPQVLSG